jgi:hypothetical protein
MFQQYFKICNRLYIFSPCSRFLFILLYFFLQYTVTEQGLASYIEKMFALLFGDQLQDL